MKDWYSTFVLSYFRWYNRMCTSADHPRYAPSLFLSALQTVNIFSLSMLLLLRFPFKISGWVVAVLFFATLFCLARINGKIINNISEIPRFSKLSDNVPGIREFPQVYGYLALTISVILLLVLAI